MEIDSEGLHPVCNTSRSDRDADIVFVHGLGGSSHGTWRHGTPTQLGHFFWPEALGRTLPHTGIWTIGYPAGITNWGMPGMILRLRAGNLSEKLVNAGLGLRPLIFIAHSMGGLILKYLIVDSQTQPDVDRKALVSAIRGIVFCGTPHRGSGYATAVTTLVTYLGGAQKHVKEMRANSDELDLLHDGFIEWHRTNPIRIESYGETRGLKRKGFFRGWFSLGRVVDRSEANPNIQGAHFHDLDEDHIGLVKPRGESHDIYAGVARFIGITLEDVSNVKPPPNGVPGPPIREMERPTVGSIPVLDPDAQVRRMFVGRDALLEDFELALDELVESQTQARRGIHPSRILWIYGFGGMGKSWFLRKCWVASDALNERHTAIRVAFIDWHLQGWHEPASTPPDGPRDMFLALAYRLAQLYGVHSLDEFWNAKRKVDRAWERHRQLREQLDAALAFVAVHGPEWRQRLPETQPGDSFLPSADPRTSKLSLLERLLRERDEWSDDMSELTSRAKQLRATQYRFDSAEGSDLFAVWARELARGEGEEVIRPSGVLTEALQQGIRQLCATTPLMLVLDTCELLSSELDSWLRHLIAPLIAKRLPLLVLIGSRFRPDIAILPGARGGWRDLVEPGRFRMVQFDQDVHFTIREIRQALDLLSQTYPEHPLPSVDLDELAALLHHVTLGVPMAIGTLFAMHLEETGQDSVLLDLASLDTGAGLDLDHRRAVRTVIEAVASRFLTHLTDRPSRAKDLHDITALALLRHANDGVLRHLWKDIRPIDRLRELGIRYALLADGDLHATVREYLRRHWLRNPPPGLKAVAQELFEALRANRPSDTDAGLPAWVDWQIESINLTLWLDPMSGMRRLMPTLAVLLAYDYDHEELQVLTSDLMPTGRKEQEAIEILRHSAWSEQLSWNSGIPVPVALQLEAHHTPEWTALESGCLRLVVGRTLAENKEYDEAIKRFQLAFDELSGAAPQKDFFMEIYLDAVKDLGQSFEYKAIAVRALDQATRHGFEPKQWDSGFYWTLHNAGHYYEAAAYCRRMLPQESKGPYHDYYDHEFNHARTYLAHILAVHLDAIGEAEEILLEGLKKATGLEAANLHYEYAELLEKRGEYQNAYDQCQISLDIGYLSDESRASVLVRMGRLANRLGNRSDSAAHFRKAIELADQDKDILNAAAWAQYSAHGDMAQAQTWARRAAQKAPRDLNVLHTLAAILIRADNQPEGERTFVEWANRVDPSKLRSDWEDYHPQCCDSVRQGRSASIATLLKARSNEEEWRIVQLTLAGFEGRGERWVPPEDLGQQEPRIQTAVSTLAQQILACIRRSNRCELADATFPI